MSFVSHVQSVERTLRDVFDPTPLHRSQFLSEQYEADIYIKREDATPVRSYKIRGAYHLLSTLTPEEKARGVVCASAGNHAQGVAYACATFGVRGTIFMPITTPGQKIEKTRFFGKDLITIRLIGDTFDQSADAARAFCEAENLVFIPPFDHLAIIAGQATVAAEFLAQLDGKTPDRVLVPVGGGGLAAGVSQYLAEASPDARVTCAEPQGAPSLTKAFEAGQPVMLEAMDTFVDGASVGKIGEHNFPILKQYIHEPVQLIPENRLCETILDFLLYEGIILEPAGALAIDALKNLPREEIKGKTIVCVASGGNFDFERLPEVKERAMKSRGIKKYFILQLPQRPGALKEFLNLLGEEDDICRFEYLKKSAKSFGAVLLGIETGHPENFPTLFAKMKKAGFGYRDVTDDEILADFVI